jgi:flavin-dependent dehydrogenase
MTEPASTVQSSAEVLIVGGGPAGAATASMLARAGVDVLVLERATFPRDKPCAEYVSPQASRILADLGVLDQLESGGPAQLQGMIVRAPSGASFRGDFAASHGFRGFRDRGLALRRTVFDTVLLRHAQAAGARVIEGAIVTDLIRSARGRVTGVNVRLPETTTGRRPPTILSGRVVVGADGLHSVVARRLQLARAGRWPRRVAFVTHFEGVADMGSAGEMHVERDGYLGLADVGHGETNVALVVPASRARGAGADRAAFLTAWIERHEHLARRLRDAQRTSPVRATGPFAHHARRAWSPGAVLVGDAADFFDPFTGEGIYAALRGAELLTPYLIAAVQSLSGHDMDVALAAYDRCRRQEFRGKWMVERVIAAAVASPWIFERVVRTLARHRDMADLLVGVTGDFVPATEVLRARYVARLLLPALRANEAS